MIAILARICGVLGLILITIGILNKNDVHRLWLSIAGGVLLFIYSVYLRDYIFTPLQVIFTVAAVYQLIKIKHKS